MIHQRHPRAGGDPSHVATGVRSQSAPRFTRLPSLFPSQLGLVPWIPACAGMTLRSGLRAPEYLAWLVRRWLVMAIVAACGLSNAHAQTAEVTFDLEIGKGRVAQSMRLIRVTQGDAVRLRWSTDRPIVLHLHGYDIEIKVEPGKTADMAFTARATGRFPVEEHKSDARGGHSHGEAPLVRIEVYPR
jgi:hypothetical protein